jgi:2-succinyl-5-enolpyruvyl-6-hydroxy-3-cyclohexene-1-carboxylate synthase
MPYSDKILVQCLGELLKKYQIFDIVCSPGSRNGALMLHFSAMDEMKTYSIVDERSAAFFALGVAQQTRKPVAICCTSGSAVANYYPAMTEAFYQNIPLIVLSADRPSKFVDQFDGQTIRQHNIFINHSHANITVEDSENINQIEKKIEDAIALCFENNGPIHINLAFQEPLYQTINEIEYTANETIYTPEKKSISIAKIAELSAAWNGANRKMILVGVQFPSKKLNKLVKKLSKDPSVIVLTENTANLHSKRFFYNIDGLIFSMNENELKQIKPDLLLTIGQNIVSKKVKSFLREHAPTKHWHLDEYWQPNTYECLTHKIEANPNGFLKDFVAKTKPVKSEYFDQWKNIAKKRKMQHNNFLQKIEFCDLKVFEKIMTNIPKEFAVQLGNSTVIRYAQLFENSNKNDVFSNRGTSGIDGSTSTAIGAAWATKKPTLFITGDLSFLYDSNALWNNYISKHLRIIVINNGGGNIFKFIPGPNQTEVLEKHFEHKHFLKMDLLAKMFGFDYSYISNERELTTCLATFYAKSNKPKLLEINTSNQENAKILQAYFKVMN